MMVDRKYQVKFTKDDTLAVMDLVSRRKSFHPIKDAILEIPWDGVQRVESLFIDYLGADDNTYTRAVARKWMAGAIARVYEPGIKFEMVPIISGKHRVRRIIIHEYD